MIIKHTINNYNLGCDVNFFIDSMNKAAETLKALLKVRKNFVINKITDDNITELQIDYWNSSMIGSKANYLGDLGIDLIILARFEDSMAEDVLANAETVLTLPQAFEQPLLGLVNISTNADYSKKKSKEYFQSIILHEFIHILGFDIDNFKRMNTFVEIPTSLKYRYYINSSKVAEVARKYYNCSEMNIVPLEVSVKEGTLSSHWNARILLGDIMTEYIYPEEQVISEFTLALLEDIGYYKANYYTGGLMRYGKNKGCDFVSKSCVDPTSHITKDNFENEFFDSIVSSPKYKPKYDSSCSSGRQSRTYYYFRKYDYIPEYYQYFGDNTTGGYSAAEYCPVAREEKTEVNNSYYTGSCSLKGNGGYGTQIFYKKLITVKQNVYTIEYFNTSEELSSITGENYSDHSFCYQSTLIKKNINNTYLKVARAICYESFCSNKSLTIKINEDYFVCPRAGGKIEVDGYNGYFLCADYNLICSGTVMCNDMFDCVAKKSEVKEESYVYDYQIKTSQNLKYILDIEPDNITNYEQAENGICPINCKHCLENKKCLKCRNDYVLVANNENSEIKCLSSNEINKGYYHDNNNIYYSCIENCDACSNNNSCINCSSGFEYYNKKCHKKIDNCKEYSNNGNCSKCKDNFTFIDGNKFYCIDKEKLKDKYIQDPSDNSNYIRCENKYNNCDSCNDSRCLICKEKFVFINDNYLMCLLKSSLNMSEYFTNDNITYYSTQIYELFILQTRLIDKLLKVFLITFDKIDKNFHIKILIDIYKNSNLRNLQEPSLTNQQIDLYIDQENINSTEPGKILI